VPRQCGARSRFRRSRCPSPVSRRPQSPGQRSGKCDNGLTNHGSVSVGKVSLRRRDAMRDAAVSAITRGHTPAISIAGAAPDAAAMSGVLAPE
jgi:hypothetical protein